MNYFKNFKKVLNKIDTEIENFENNYRIFYEHTGIKPLRISGKIGDGLEDLTDEVIKIVDNMILNDNKNKKKLNK